MLRQAVHKVTWPESPELSTIKCRANPLRLVCTCKESRKTGICPEIIAVNHKLKAIDIRSELMHMQKKRKKPSSKVRVAIDLAFVPVMRPCDVCGQAGTDCRSCDAGHTAEPLWATYRACSVCGYRSTNGPMQFECRACGLALCNRHSHGHGASCEAIVEEGEGYYALYVALLQSATGSGRDMTVRAPLRQLGAIEGCTLLGRGQAAKHNRKQPESSEGSASEVEDELYIASDNDDD